MNTDTSATEADPPDDSSQFSLKDCVLIAIATGKRAGNLKELRDHILTIGTDSIYQGSI